MKLETHVVIQLLVIEVSCTKIMAKLTIGIM